MQRNHRRKRKKIDDCDRCQDRKTGYSKIQSRLNRFLHKWWQIAWRVLAIQVLTYGFLLDFTNKNRRKKIDLTFEKWPEPKIPTVSSLTTNDTFIVNLGYSSRTTSCASIPSKYNGETRPRSHNFVHYFTVVFLWLLNIDERSFVSIRIRHWREETFYSSSRNSQNQSGSDKGKGTSCKTYGAQIFASLIVLVTFTNAWSSSRVRNLDLCILLQVNIYRWILKCFVVRYYGEFMRFWKSVIRRRATIACV